MADDDVPVTEVTDPLALDAHEPKARHRTVVPVDGARLIGVSVDGWQAHTGAGIRDGCPGRIDARDIIRNLTEAARSAGIRDGYRSDILSNPAPVTPPAEQASAGCQSRR